MSQGASSFRLLSLPEGVKSKLNDFRRRTRRTKMIEAVLAAIFGFVVSFLCLFLVDRFIETPKWVRFTTLVLGSVGFALYLPYMIHRWVWNTRNLEAIAKLLHHRFPGLSDHVLSIVELAKSSSEQRRSPQLIAAAMSQVDERLFRIDISTGVPFPRVKRWTYLTTPILLLVASIALIVPVVSGNAWSRFLLPFANIERFTFARVDSLPEETVVPFAEPFDLQLQLKEHSDWKPSHAVMSLAGQSHRAPLSDSSRYAFQLPGQLEPTLASFRIGDAVQSTQVVPMLRPEVVRLYANVTLPSYLQYPAPITVEARGTSLQTVKGSEVQMMAKVNRDIAEASISAQKTIYAPSVEGTEMVATLESIELNCQSVGSEIHADPISLQSHHKVQFEWRDSFGLNGSKPLVASIRSLDDMVPTVSCSRLPDPPVHLSTEILRFDVAALDDFGLKHVGIQWKSIDNEGSGKPFVQGERLILAGKYNAMKLEGLATVSCEQEKIVPQWLEIRAFTEDLYPERGRVYSVPYLIHVMSPEEHAQWIGEQIRRWKGRADAAYEEEVRMLEENRRIRDLSSKELDSEDSRQRMTQQEMAERANAKRLESVVGDGQKLLEQALRNEEIRSKQIEQWARALQRMNELAENRMPELADSIGKASSTPPSDSESKEDKPLAPKILDDQSSSYDKSDPNNSSKESSGGSDRLTIPETKLAPNPNSSKEEPKSEESEVKKKMDEVVRDQSKLLEEFRQSKQAFEDLMADFENSSFVKRFKASSQFQKQIVDLLTQAIGSNFGRSSEKAKAAELETNRIVEMQKILSEKVKSLMTDLAAYQNNNPAAGREAVLKEMKERNVLIKLEEMPARMNRNLRGDALNRSEFWADTFDRWAEELAGPGNSGGGQGNDEEKDSLPPALLLEIMRIIGDEIDLRDETRTLNQLVTEDNKNSDDIEERTSGQAITQMAIQERTLNVLNDIQALPGNKNFGEELEKIKKALQHMDDASSMLSDLRLGDDVIASETAAIEALIQTRRGGKGGGGGDSGGDGSGATGSTSRSPLDLVGPGADRSAKIMKRQSGEGTGRTGRVLPEQYRQGLDRFLNRAGKR